MKAAVFIAANTPLEIRDYAVTPTMADHALVTLETSGVCGTDIHIWEGAIPLTGPVILGHEYIGRIAEFGAGARQDCLGAPLAIGDRVAVNVIEPCGQCLLCKTGGAASCLHLGESLTYTRSADEPPYFHGGFAEVNFSPTRYLHKIPSAIPAEIAAAFLCAGPTVIRGMAYAGGFVAGEHVIVQGAGPVGLFAVLYARHSGARSVTMIGSGTNPFRLELARDLGATDVLDIHAISQEERFARVREITGGVGADVIIEGTGNPQAVLEGLPLLRARGRYVWAGQYSDRGTINIPTHLITTNALQIFGSAQFTVEDRTAYFQFLLQVQEQWATIRRVITDRFTIDQANDAFAKAQCGQSVKTIFVGGE
ncbi:MAG TPA: alcohol dehydrogenase catalytic domain-containing protein [Armatimonadota bacterium]|nr:alcohol dehydrogenase catalytic domain-containing protein [Armatimonadota bacterium]